LSLNGRAAVISPAAGHPASRAHHYGTGDTWAVLLDRSPHAIRRYERELRERRRCAAGLRVIGVAPGTYFAPLVTPSAAR